METRTLGRTGLRVSVLSYGCGAVGGLMVKGSAADQERAIARAIAAGVRYLDTAPLYGNGISETNLGRILKSLKADVLVGTKVRVPAAGRADLAATITSSLEQSLRRLGRDHVDLFQLHNRIGAPGELGAADIGLEADVVLGEVVPVLERLRREGKTRFIGITAVGDTPALHRVIDSGALDTAQVVYNLLCPSAGGPMPQGFPAQDYDDLLGRMVRIGMGSIGIRVLAGGALSGSEARHPVGLAAVDPIGSGSSYALDAARARRLQGLVEEGFAASLIEAAIRFAISQPAMSTILVGTSTNDELEVALAAAEKGPLPRAALLRVAELHRGLAGEPR